MRNSKSLQQRSGLLSDKITRNTKVLPIIVITHTSESIEFKEPSHNFDCKTLKLPQIKKKTLSCSSSEFTKSSSFIKHRQTKSTNSFYAYNDWEIYEASKPPIDKRRKIVRDLRRSLKNPSGYASPTNMLHIELSVENKLNKVVDSMLI